ncbi:hypothetical protein ACH5RR_034314, partial [Cinchona calisaya]
PVLYLEAGFTFSYRPVLYLEVALIGTPYNEMKSGKGKAPSVRSCNCELTVI